MKGSWLPRLVSGWWELLQHRLSGISYWRWGISSNNNLSRGYCYSSLQIFYISLGAVQWGQDDCIQCDEGKVLSTNNNKNMEFYILCRTGSEMHFIYRTNIPILLFTITTISPISTLSPTMTSLLASRRKTSNWKLWFDSSKTPARLICLISSSLKATFIDTELKY